MKTKSNSAVALSGGGILHFFALSVTTASKFRVRLYRVDFPGLGHSRRMRSARFSGVCPVFPESDS